nr:hypothetical protein [uncultured Rhodopila sp.]
MPEIAPIPTITVWQPWATLIAEELKPLEFRGWPAHAALIGQRIGIHAGARPVRKDEVRDLLLKLQSLSWRETGLVREGSIELLTKVLMAPGGLPLSSILCTAVLGQPIRNQDLATRMGIELMCDSDRGEHSNYGWPLTDVEKLKPFVPVRGARGFWPWHQVQP